MATEYKPDYCAPPGTTIRETVEFKGMTRHQFGKSIGLNGFEVDDLYRGSLAISAELAAKIEQATGVRAHVLLNMERAWREFVARKVG